jgi:hypothetical protein
VVVAVVAATAETAEAVLEALAAVVPEEEAPIFKQGAAVKAGPHASK